MDGWWDNIEQEIREFVERRSSATMDELAQHLAMSRDAAASILRVLGITGEMRLTATSWPTVRGERQVQHG